MLKSKVGIEAEFLLLNSEDEVIVPPKHWDRDGFPLLGEIRADPGGNFPDTIANFVKKKMEIEARIRKGNKLTLLDVAHIRLATYKEVMKQVTETKGEQIGKVRNIYGTTIEDYSDQIIGKNHKIQGIRVSCGLHIHFSCYEEVTKTVKDVEYTPVSIPIKVAAVKGGEGAILKELIQPSLDLYSKKYLFDDDKKVITACASVLSQPVIEFIVKTMDELFFNKFAPSEKDRTKYRQPGFYELKPYGFEYRSLPANNATINALPEIVNKAFELLNSLFVYDSLFV